MVEYKLMQGGQIVASVSCEDEEKALKEIQHYAMIYCQDGEVEIIKVKDDANCTNSAVGDKNA